MSRQLETSKDILEKLKGWSEELEGMECDDFRDLKEHYDELSSALGDLIVAKESAMEDEKKRLEKRKKRKS
jgi:hypothetical protein